MFVLFSLALGEFVLGGGAISLIEELSARAEKQVGRTQ